MSFDLSLLPSGHLHCCPLTLDINLTPKFKELHEKFLHNINHGLITLAADKTASDLSPTLKYWHDFSTNYLSTRCNLVETDVPTQGELTTNIVPNQIVSIAPLDLNLATKWLQSAPPMIGLEYLTIEVLQDIWTKLDEWIQERIKTKGSLAAVLSEDAPQWHPVGRVCFHLAENKLDINYPFAFMATYAPEQKSENHVRYRPLYKALQEYAEAKDKPNLIRLLTPVSRASESSLLIKNLVDSGDIYHPLAWTAEDAYQFLSEVPLYEASGLVTRLPNWWRKRARPRVDVRIGNKAKNNFGVNTLLDFDLQVTLGDETLNAQELEALLNGKTGLVFIKGQWVEANSERLNEALIHWKKIEKQVRYGELNFAEGMRLLAGTSIDLTPDDSNEAILEWSKVEAGTWLKDLLKKLRSPEAISAAKPGAALKANLRPYQEQGVSWLWFLSQLGLGGCLADDMGLGKTIQVISLLLLFKQNHVETNINIPSLIVLPTSLLANWQAELERFAPSLRLCFIHGSQMPAQELDALDQQESMQQELLKKYDVVLTTYGTLARREWLQKHTWRLLVIDEAQAIKSPGARQTKIVKQIKANSRLALTGTPVENSLTDLWSIFDFLNPGLLGNANRFKNFAKSLTTRTTDQYAPLRQLTQPYILRRLKTDRKIITDLPEKSEVNAWCGLSKVQATYYQKTVKDMQEVLDSLEGIKRSGIVLTTLQRLKQICNHPAQFLGHGEYEPAKSGKFQRLAELCEEIAVRQEKVLVFTQFREISQHLADFLAKKFNRPGLVLHGGTTVDQRRNLVEQFQQEEGPPFFVLSLKAGGVGLNLTEASHVIHFDRWWNPAVENQATDRAFRIGQKKNVLVHKFICRGTLEEKIDALIRDKTALASDLLQDDKEMPITEMSDEALLQLISLDIEKSQI